MTISGIRVAENNPDEIRRHALGGRQANAEELLAELVRLVESSGLAERSPPIAETVAKPSPMDAGPMQALEAAPLSPSVGVAPSKPRGTGAVDVEPPRSRESDDLFSNGPNGIDRSTGRRSGAWTVKVSALVLVGAAVIGSIFWLKQDRPGPPKAPSFIATAQGPAIVQSRSDLTVAPSSDAAAAPLSDITQPAQVKGAASEERPIDLDARASLNNPTRSADLGPPITGEAQPAAVASAGKPLAAPVDTPAPAALTSPPPASQSLDSKPAPTVSLPTGSPKIATPNPSATDTGQAQASDAPLPPVRPTPKAADEAAGDAQGSTPKLELPTKLSSKAAHGALAKADATAPGASVETPRRALRRGASVKPEKGTTTVTPAQDPAEAQAAPPPPPAPAQPAPQPQPNTNPVVHAFNNMVGMVGALTSFIPFTH
jgi:hypothetical protein